MFKELEKRIEAYLQAQKLLLGGFKNRFSLQTLQLEFKVDTQSES
ncbi:MAG: hypothetical protein QXK12_03655 [Candidatus Nezhaarchaeales archaeon]